MASTAHDPNDPLLPTGKPQAPNEPLLPPYPANAATEPAAAGSEPDWDAPQPDAEDDWAADDQYDNPYEAVSKPSPRAYLLSRDFWLTLVYFGLGLLGLLAVVLFIVLPVYTRHGDSIAVPKVTDLTVARAELLLDNADLAHAVIDSQYIAGKPPLSVIAQEPPAGQRVKPGRTIYLVVNKERPPLTKLPDIIDVNLAQARYLLENWGLEVGQLRYSAGEATDLILSASTGGKPLKPGDPVQVGTRVDLEVSRGRGAAVVTVPDLTGMSIGEASSAIADLGLTIGQVRFGTSSQYKANDIVYMQSPAGGVGTTLAVGATIDLWVTGTRGLPGQSDEPIERVDQ